MGQYHNIYAITPSGDVETVNPFKMGALLKLGEKYGPYSWAFGLLVQSRWKGCRLVVVGDYAEDSDLPAGVDYTINQLCKSAHDITDVARGMLRKAFGVSFADGTPECPSDFNERVERLASQPGDAVILASNGEYVSPARFDCHPSWNGSCVVNNGVVWTFVHAMLACSDGRGGGDFDLSPAGRWAGCSLGVVGRSLLPASAVDVSDWLLANDEVQWGVKAWAS